MGLRQSLSTLNRDLDSMVARTPPHRDRYIDFLRIFAIGVVVVWHWSLSILYWTDDRWVMPNPIAAVPGGWLATWPLQIMPVFFIVGGYANAAGWMAARRDGAGLSGFYRTRLRRLLLPIGVFLAVWTILDLLLHLLVPDYLGVLRYGWILFAPLWFIAAYVWVVLLTPLTATAHARARWLTLAGLAAAVTLADLGRFAAGWDALGWVNSALVWVLIHQLGYFYRDSTAGSSGLTGRERRVAAAMVVSGLVALAALTSLEAYPRSMVATIEADRSNIFPTTITIPLVAVVQLGLVWLLREPVTRWLQRPGVWKPVVAGNSVILTIFLWHMTALLAVLAVLRALDVDLRTEPTLAWWLERPLWLLAPAPILALLVAVFGRVERASAARR